MNCMLHRCTYSWYTGHDIYSFLVDARQGGTRQKSRMSKFLSTHVVRENFRGGQILSKLVKFGKKWSNLIKNGHFLTKNRHFYPLVGGCSNSAEFDVKSCKKGVFFRQKSRIFQGVKFRFYV